MVFDNIRIILLSNKPTEQIVKEFLKIDYKKALITPNKDFAKQYKDVYYCPLLKKKDNPNAFTNIFGKRGYKVFDVPSFLEKND